MDRDVSSLKQMRNVDYSSALTHTESSTIGRSKRVGTACGVQQEATTVLHSRTKRKKYIIENKQDNVADKRNMEPYGMKSTKLVPNSVRHNLLNQNMEPWNVDRQSPGAPWMRSKASGSKQNSSHAPGSIVAARNIDVRCPYALHIGFLEVGKQGPFASNWDIRPGVCSPNDHVACDPCPIICKLLEKQMLRLGERVWWKGDRARAIAVGWICRNGILCGRCGWVKDTHGFQTCAGILTDDAASFIQATCMVSLGDLHAAQEEL